MVERWPFIWLALPVALVALAHLACGDIVLLILGVASMMQCGHAIFFQSFEQLMVMMMQISWSQVCA